GIVIARPPPQRIDLEDSVLVVVVGREAFDDPVDDLVGLQSNRRWPEHRQDQERQRRAANKGERHAEIPSVRRQEGRSAERVDSAARGTTFYRSSPPFTWARPLPWPRLGFVALP